MSSLYNSGGTFQNGPFGQNSQYVIPQITIPSGIGFQSQPQQRWEPFTAKGRDAAYRMYTPPGVRVAIFDEDNPVFYFKETDQSGNIIAFDEYDYIKHTEPEPPQYLTVEEFNKFKEELLNGQSVRTQGVYEPHYNNTNTNQQSRSSDADPGSK